MVLYPVYALLFADTGLSAGEISSLFAIWSVTGFVLEIPSGVWADLISRRRLLVAAPLLTGAGYALWTFLPSYPAFALGFVLWGAGGSLRSGTLQALVYEELDRLGAAGSYARLTGRSAALGTTAFMAATALAGPVLSLGGYHAAGLASVLATVLAAAVGLTLPESRGPECRDPAGETGYLAVLRDGLSEIRKSDRVRRTILLLSLVSGLSTLDEYIPFLAESTGVPVSAVPLLVLLVSAGMTAGGWAAGRAPGAIAPGLAVGAVCLAAGAASRLPAGFVLVAAAFGVFHWAVAGIDARLQEQVADGSRATVTSMAGLGTEVVCLAVYAGYGAGSRWADPWLIFSLAGLPCLLAALMTGSGRLGRRGRRRDGR
ncbi:MFS transporter [Microbispora sp. RL4-1S]|uniref:MFS transporter n=1 Tax=Microbispora oryzae TaxID=2806554 RepID=A0A941ALA0_9ACTN|nr:MFS transporter [Microbispora oryzae]MBP2708370.1 MFS transporter [Microbispora oryzae]